MRIDNEVRASIYESAPFFTSPFNPRTSSIRDGLPPLGHHAHFDASWLINISPTADGQEDADAARHDLTHTRRRAAACYTRMQNRRSISFSFFMPMTMS